MNPPEEVDFETRRKDLAAEIARQRGHLAQAYQQLEKPIRYTEYGMRGFGFIRQNPWVVAAVPLALNFAASFFGGKKGKSPSAPSASSTKAKGALGKAQQVLATGVRHGWNLYQLYRRVRSLIP
jgi:hypothetical protein